MSKFCNYLTGICQYSEKECRHIPAITCHNMREKLIKQREEAKEDENKSERS